jgi:glycosyltransferase involved in cell wall biosynthesis
MSHHPLVSIVTPAFNAGKFICETIQSVRAQTFANWELIVVDDGSTDDTQKAVEPFLTDPRIRLLCQINLGVSLARNAALRVSKGEWIAFLDADDVWFPEKLAQQLSAVELKPAANLVFTNYFIWDGDRDLELRFKNASKFPADQLERRLIFHNLFGMSSVLVRRSVLEEAGEFDQTVAPAEDWDIWLRIADKGLRAVGIDKALLRYRVWNGNASKNSLRLMQSNVRILQKALQRPVNKHRQRDYARALQIACGNLELARASAGMMTAPGEVPDRIFRAWRHCPSKVKWLLWYIAASWPTYFGGAIGRRHVYKKIQSKW